MKPDNGIMKLLSEHVEQADKLDAGFGREAVGPPGETRWRKIEKLGLPRCEQDVVGCA
jgi:hypothetical protein